MILSDLIALTRNLAGDPSYQGNSTAWTDDEIVAALNWAQTRYAELTHCTYKEVAAPAVSDATGIFTVPPGFILVDRVMIPDPSSTGPDATLTVPATALNGTPVNASVPDQAGASYFWCVAGGTLTAGQGTNAITFTGLAVAGAVATVACLVSLNGQTDVSAADVAMT